MSIPRDLYTDNLQIQFTCACLQFVPNKICILNYFSMVTKSGQLGCGVVLTLPLDQIRKLPTESREDAQEHRTHRRPSA